MATVIPLPEGLIALQEELKNFPDLAAICKTHEHFEMQLGEIAAYCGIVVDEWVDVGPFCDLLVRELKKKSSIILLN